jgi:RNAse (barnase) inhibitor barstar
MEPSPDSPSWWHSLPYSRRYKKLQQVRRLCCWRVKSRDEDKPGLTVHLDGTWINDVPSFYLSLGEAINGPYGYFGACLDSLSDCLCGSFGVRPPLTIYLSNFDKVWEALLTTRVSGASMGLTLRPFSRFSRKAGRSFCLVILSTTGSRCTPLAFKPCKTHRVVWRLPRRAQSIPEYATAQRVRTGAHSGASSATIVVPAQDSSMPSVVM